MLQDAIQLRSSLEIQAKELELQGGPYIRPIVLFQAQPNVKESSATFTKIKESLVKVGIPPEQIAIKTADVDDLQHTDLMSRDCPIRYIITVNALKKAGTAPLPISWLPWPIKIPGWMWNRLWDGSCGSPIPGNMVKPC